MAHHVLARKWRPQEFSDLAGQEHVVQALSNALEQNRLHHAYLFSGTRGVGKTTIGRILARCLNCEQGVTAHPCGECSSCLEITEGRSLDLIEVDAASRTKVDDTRELLDNVQFAPAKARYKIYLIDEVHMLSNSSFNALLKTIEEPPEHVIFLFATTHPQKIPATVLSRCLQFHLKNMTVEQIAGHLTHILEEESVASEKDALFEIARAAAGSMRDALSLTEQAIAFGSGSISRQQVQDMLGVVDATLLLDLLDALFAMNADAALDGIRQYASQAVDFGLLLDELLGVLHRLALIQVVPESANNLPDSQHLQALAQRIPPEDIQLFYQTVIQCKKDFPFAPDPLTGLEMMVLRLIGFRKMVAAEIEDLQQSAKVVEKTTEGLPAKKSDTVLESPSAQLNEVDEVVEKSAARAKPTKGRSQPIPAGVVSEGSDTASRQSVSVPAEPAEASNLAISEGPLSAVPDIASLTNPLWCEIFSSLPLNGVVRAVASQCLLIEVAGSVVSLGLLEDNAALYKADSANKLAAGLSIYFGEQLSCKIEVVGHWNQLPSNAITSDMETPADYRQRLQEQRTARAVKELANDSNVQTLIDTFDATFDEDSVQFNEPKDS